MCSSDLPGRITKSLLLIAGRAGVQPGFWHLGLLFIATLVAKSVAEVWIRHAVLRIKYSVLGSLIDESLRAFFEARWSFFSGTDQGRLMNTLNKELPNIGDALGIITTLLAQVVQLATYLAVPMWLNPAMTATALVLAILFGAPFLALHRLSYRLGKRDTETGNAYVGALNEVLGAARLEIGRAHV